MGSAKGSTKQESTQRNDPPAWATPLLQEAAAKAMQLYKSGKGYNVYTGPTQAQFSNQRLEGLNNAMKMTGSTGPQITNESVFNNPAIQQARAKLKQQQQQQAKPATQTAQMSPAIQRQIGDLEWQRQIELNRGGSPRTIQNLSQQILNLRRQGGMTPEQLGIANNRDSIAFLRAQMQQRQG